MRTAQGGFCTSTGGRVVGDVAGHVDYALDLMRELDAAGQCPPDPDPRGQPGGHVLPPFLLGSMWAGGGLGIEEGDDPARGRIARRTLPGRTVLSGTADAAVRSLTFASPSDVRTLAPTGAAHAFIVVYAGNLPTGRLVVTTTFADGRMRRDEVSVGF